MTSPMIANTDALQLLMLLYFLLKLEKDWLLSRHTAIGFLTDCFKTLKERQ